MRRKKGQELLIGGGHYHKNNQYMPQGQLIKDLLDSWKPFDAPIRVLNISRNSYDEAVHIHRLAQQDNWKDIILVTSAWHMKRAEALFKKAGLNVFPMGAGFEGMTYVDMPYTIEGIIPNFDGFVFLSRYMHEKIGWLYYKTRGWI